MVARQRRGPLFLTALLAIGVSGAQPRVCEAQIRKAGSEFQVNTLTHYGQLQPRVDRLTSDQFVVAWLGYNPDPGAHSGIRAQIFDRSAARVGEEFLVSTFATTDSKIEQHPSVARSGDLGFVIAWEGYEIGEDTNVAAQRYSSDGSQVGTAVPINASAARHKSPSVAAASSGAFVVAWISQDSLFTPRARARKFNADGTPATGELELSHEDGVSRDVSVAMQPDDGFVVVWQEDGAGILAQRFDESATELGAPISVSPSGNRHPEIATTEAGDFVVVWQNYGGDGSGYGVFGRRFASDGASLSEAFPINSHTADQQVLPSVAADSAGRFVVVWESYASLFEDAGGQDGSGRGVFGQYFASDGRPTGREFQVNTYVAGDQGNQRDRESDVTMWPDGGFVATWTSPEQDGDYEGVFGQVFSVDSMVGALCGDAANSDLLVTAKDALAVLRTGVGLQTCEMCLCDADGSGDVSATDAFAVLTTAVGLKPDLECPACAE